MNVLANELARRFEQIQPMDFYRSIFPLGELDNLDAMTPGKYAAIAVEIQKEGKKETAHRYTVTDDLDVIDALQVSQGFCVLAPISYVGKNRKSENARFMYALVVELDHLLEDGGLDRLIEQWSDRVHWIPRPTYTVASGTGLHLYYQFEQPIPLFPNIVQELKNYKRDLTERIWNKHVTHDTGDKIQQESIFQPFRMVGTLTKLGDKVEAFCTGEPVSIEYMNRYVKEENQVTMIYKSKLTLAEAKKKYPDWYQRRVVEKQPKGHWTNNRALYDWWKGQIREQAVVGHRYYCLMILAIYAVKCDISREELEEDSFELMELFEQRTDSPTNHFTESDVITALQTFEDKDVVTYPLKAIIYRSGIQIEKNKRNGRKRKDHIVLMNTMKSLKRQLGEEMAEGRPSKQKVVQRWRKKNPEGKKADCAKELKIDPKTVRKWWDAD